MAESPLDGEQGGTPQSEARHWLGHYLVPDKPVQLVVIDSDQLQLHGLEFPDTCIRASSLNEAENALQPLREAGSAHDAVALMGIESSGVELEQSLGRAVRLFPEKLVVHTLLRDVPDATFFALGFRRLDVQGQGEQEQARRWFEFRLSHYKLPPEWLNARFWANPERFELDEDELDEDDDDDDEND